MILVGSQAIHGSMENPPKELTKSNEVDLWIPNDPGRTELVEALFGRESQFEITHGYHADAVSPDTARLPRGWWDRHATIILTDEETGEMIDAVCPDVSDLAVSKLCAGRPKDYDFVSVLLRENLLLLDTLRERLKELDGQDRLKLERSIHYFSDGRSFLPQ